MSGESRDEDARFFGIFAAVRAEVLKESEGFRAYLEQRLDDDDARPGVGGLLAELLVEALNVVDSALSPKGPKREDE